MSVGPPPTRPARPPGSPSAGTPPFGHPRPLQVLVDRDLLVHDVLWAAAGTPDSVFPIVPDDLVRSSGGRPADFKEEG